jgi:hypothetical protein
MPTASKSTSSSQIETDTPRFDFLLPATKQWFHLGEIAKLIGMSESFVEVLYDRGEISGHEYNAGTGQRMAKRVPRAFVVALLVKSARYNAETKQQAFLSCLHEFSADQLRQIATAANCLSARKAQETTAVGPRGQEDPRPATARRQAHAETCAARLSPGGGK